MSPEAVFLCVQSVITVGTFFVLRSDVLAVHVLVNSQRDALLKRILDLEKKVEEGLAREKIQHDKEEGV